MAVTVNIPTIMRPLTADRKTVETSGSSVLEAIDDLESRFPGIRDRLITDDTVHRFVNIYVNDTDIRFSDSLATPIEDGDTVTILPAVAGG